MFDTEHAHAEALRELTATLVETRVELSERCMTEPKFRDWIKSTHTMIYKILIRFRDLKKGRSWL